MNPVPDVPLATTEQPQPATAAASTPVVAQAVTTGVVPTVSGAALSPHVGAQPRVAAGMAFGLLGVAIFALTLPMTRLAVGDVADPQLPPAFATAGRAALAGLFAFVWLVMAKARRPPWRLAVPLAVCAAGTIVGFPLGLSLALREVPSVHAAVVTGLMPLATAALGALTLGQRASVGFWVCAIAGCALVIGFAAWQGGGHLQVADGWLLMAVVTGAAGYVGGARATAEMPAAHVISWVLLGALPLTVPTALWLWPVQPVRATAWVGFGYTALFSMWLGFFAWYRGLALGGVMRVSQVQLVQPFLALLFAAALLREPLDPATLAFAAAVVAVVFIGRRMPVSSPPVAAATHSPTRARPT